MMKNAARMRGPAWRGPAWLCLSVAAAMTSGCGDGRAMAMTAPELPDRPAAPPATRAQDGSGATLRVELDLLARRARRQTADAGIGDAFGATSWYVPPPPPPPVAVVPAAAPPPPKPSAPPLPFTYFGSYADAGTEVVMLVKGDQLYTVSEGDTIDNSYRVDRVAAGMIELTYLPLNIKQSVVTGDAS